MIVASALATFPWSSNTPERFPIIYTAPCHEDCLRVADYYAPYRGNEDKDIYGFMTDTYQFLDPYEAKIHARKCKQLIRDTDDRALKLEDIAL